MRKSIKKKNYITKRYRKTKIKKSKTNKTKQKQYIVNGGAEDAIGNSMKAHDKSSYLKAKEEREKELAKLRADQLVKKQRQEILKKMLLQKMKK